MAQYIITTKDGQRVDLHYNSDDQAMAAARSLASSFGRAVIVTKVTETYIGQANPSRE
jgi:hypothetical protein